MYLNNADNTARALRDGERRPRWLAILLGALFVSQAASAQQEAEVEAAQTDEPTTTTTTTYAQPWVPKAGTNLDAHLPSSSHSKADINSPDTFDFDRSQQNYETLRGNKNSLGILESDREALTGAQPRNPIHVVDKGDTLWAICDRQFDDPRLWPRVWSFNPQVQNPHWIYPGDQLRLAPHTELDGVAAAYAGLEGGSAPRRRSGVLGSGAFASRQALVAPETVFLRELGYIDEPADEQWGEVVGARVERQLLADGNEIYMLLRPGVSVKLGQKMTIYREVRQPEPVAGARPPPGEIISFQGTVEVNQWSEETRVARGKVIESLDIIERGAKIGPIGRRFHVVPPKPSEIDLRAHVLTSLYPHLLLGQNQVLFIDRGTNDGLKPGNRLSVVRRGDAWRRTLVTTTIMARTRIRMDVPERIEVEETPLLGDEESFPEETIAEVRVIRTHPYASLVLVTASSEEIEPGDTLVARKGL